MGEFRAVAGEGKTMVTLWADDFGSDLIVHIYNDNAHVGAVAVGEYDHAYQRASVSVHTRLGHKDDAIARQAAYTISKATKKAVCVIAGVHVDDITPQEIDRVLVNSEALVTQFIASQV
jgi:hypothetical protein